MIEILVITAVVFAFSAGLTLRFCDPSSIWHILDHPNERSLHTRPTPRSGGVAIIAGILVGTGIAGWQYDLTAFFIWLIPAVLLVAIISSLDDRYRISVLNRFIVHFTSASLLILGGAWLQFLELPGWLWAWPHWYGFVFSLLFIVWMVNLFNFMDGMDGFAGGMSVIGFGTFAVLGVMSGNVLFTALSLIVGAGAGGFLLFNFPPARIFMGDAGSSTLGLLAAALSLWGARDGIFPFWVALLVFSPFIVDATVTLSQRLVRGERVWQAHKTHYYQRLVLLGWGHRKTVLYEYGLMVSCALSAVAAVQMESMAQQLIIVAWSCLYLLLMATVAWLEMRKKSL